jgi:hypothetical protein
MTKYLALNIPGYGTLNAPAKIPTRTGAGMLSRISGNLFTMVFILAIVIALIFFILGGIQWIMSEGDKSKVQAARMRITYAIVGLILLLASFFIVNMVGYFFNVKLL